MGEEKKPRKVKLFFALLFSDEDTLQKTEKRLMHDFGEIDTRSIIFPFHHTSYYEKEMGSDLFKRFISIKPLIKRDELPGIKKHTNLLENLFAYDNQSRTVNIDPGYLTDSKMILATTKDYSHRIYIGKKIFAEVTLHYSAKEKSYIPWEWTYPDYQDKIALEYFNELKKIYKDDLRREQ